MNPDLVDRIENDHTYHRPNAEGVARMVQIRSAAKSMALLIAETVPQGREQSSALTRLEEVVFHANAGIARNSQFKDTGAPAGT